jgi:hypothetical protein
MGKTIHLPIDYGNRESIEFNKSLKSLLLNGNAIYANAAQEEMKLLVQMGV